MKTNFDSKLFDKKIDLKSCNSFVGGDSGCTDIQYTNGQTDSITRYYDEDGNLVSKMECNW